MNTSQFMDKQIMDISNSQSNNSDSDFLDLINPPVDHHHHHIVGDSDKKEEILPSYDFQPIRPLGSSSPPSKMDSTGIGAPRSWNSADNNKNNATGVRNYSSLESFEPSRFSLERDQSAIDPALVSEIDLTMKKYADNMMLGLDNVSARLSQLESRTRHLENSLDELKVSVGTNHGSSDGRMRQLENILREIQNGVQIIRDKQDMMDARLELSKLQLPKVEQLADIHSTEHVDSSQAATAVGQPSHQQLPPVPLPHPPSGPLPNAPPPPASQQNILPQVQQPSHYPPSQPPSVPQRESYFSPPALPPPPGPAIDNMSQQYQLPGQQLPTSSQPQPQPQAQHQYQPHPQLPYSQPPAPPQPHNPVPTANPSQPHLPLTHHHPEESPYVPSQNYPPAVRQTPQPPPPPSAAPPLQQFYGASASMYEPPPNRPGPGFSGTYGLSAGSGEQFPYSQYGSGSPAKPQHMASPAIGHNSGGSGYPQLPTARILPHAVPTASAVGGGPGSPGSGNRVPIDDVVDKVTNMGFSREQVRATVRKLTENGQAVDLNVVLDKLMNDGDVQPPRGWFGR